MPSSTSRLVDRYEVAEGTMAFAFARPAGFDFVAGQFLTLILPEDSPHADARGNRRVFTITSPPQEASHLTIATRMTGSGFKRNLAEQTIGSPVTLFGPSGSFNLHEDQARPAVFIAGGIGITPFRSILHDAFARRLAHRITLVYSNRNPEGMAFHDEFQRMAERNASFDYVPTVTHGDQSSRPWDGERRLVDGAFLRHYIRDFSAPVFYVAGPPGMVTAVKQVILEAGANAAQLKSEEFLGYAPARPAH